jgi:hypothetical protein
MLPFKELFELNIRVQKMGFLMQILQFFINVSKSPVPTRPFTAAIYRAALLLVE